jgi:hypothetical protein
MGPVGTKLHSSSSLQRASPFPFYKHLGRQRQLWLLASLEHKHGGCSSSPIHFQMAILISFVTSCLAGKQAHIDWLPLFVFTAERSERAFGFPLTLSRE